MALDDQVIAGLVSWEVAAKVTALPPPTALLRRLPRWVRWAFAGVLAGIVIVHLDAVPTWEDS